MGDGRTTTGFLEEPALHGGGIDVVRRQYPQAPEPWIDLSTGINPIAYPIPVLDLETWQRLPLTSHEHALLTSATRRYRANSTAHIVAAPGTQALIQVLPHVVPARRVAVVGPTYAEHARCWRHAGAMVDHVTGIDGAIAADADVVVVVNPNNPTGHSYTATQLRDAAAELARRGAHLVVDEAFADLCGDDVSLCPALPRNAIVLRSFGKTYGLAGLRLGFAICAPEFARHVRDVLGPWAVSGPALHVGRVALDDDAWLHSARARLCEDVARLQGLLQRAGFDIVGTTPLFVLGDVADAKSVCVQLARAGIHVRAFPEHPTWLRFGLPGDAANWQRLSDALAAKDARG